MSEISIKNLITSDQVFNSNVKNVQRSHRNFINQGETRLIESFNFGHELPLWSEGVYIYTSTGNKIMDLTGGFGVLGTGHNNRRILEVRKKYIQEKRVEIHDYYYSQAMTALAHNLAKILPGTLNKSFFCNSGAEAIEGSLKLAYKFHRGTRGKVLVADNAFHGKLLGSGGLTSSEFTSFRFPSISGIEKFKFNNIKSFSDLVLKSKANAGHCDVYALVIEPFSVSHLQEYSLEFLEEARRLCDENGIILICDEIYSGWAKTTELFSFMRSEIVPDILVMSKTFGGGKSSISCFVTKEEVFNGAYGASEDSSLHTTTYSGFGEECITALESVNLIIEEDYCQKSRRIHEKMTTELRSVHKDYPDLITNTTGSGTIHGIFFSEIDETISSRIFENLADKIINDSDFVKKLTIASVMSELYNTHKILVGAQTKTCHHLLVSTTNIILDEEIDGFFVALRKTLSLGRNKLISKFIYNKFKLSLNF